MLIYERRALSGRARSARYVRLRTQPSSRGRQEQTRSVRPDGACLTAGNAAGITRDLLIGSVRLRPSPTGVIWELLLAGLVTFSKQWSDYRRFAEPAIAWH